jgi:hypothetical protein
MSGRDDDEREKRSWNEIDKLRDRGGSGRPRSRSERDDSTSSFLKSESRKQQYLKQVDQGLFGKKSEPARDDAKKVLLGAIGKRTFTAKARAFWEEYTPIHDWEVILALLDVDSPDFLEEICQHLADLFSLRSPAEQKMAISKLRIVKMSAKDPDLSEVAGECLEAIDR